MLNWLKWRLAGKELQELHRWRVKWNEYRAWLAEFDEISTALENLKSEVDGKQLNTCLPPADDGPWGLEALRIRLRKAKQYKLQN